MKRSNWPDLLGFTLILMYSYAAASKLIIFNSLRLQLLVQPLPRWSVTYLVYIIPASEVIVVMCLLFKSTRITGFIGSATLMLMFTMYVGLAMSGAFGSIPCSCGGIIQKLSWAQHFIFNLIFLTISIYGIILDQKERRFIGR